MGNRKIIKSVEVSDFRGLHGTRTLDFEGADIVLLLGLNGFGKTSVFDSIEWCLTGKLSRYERYTETGRRQDFGKEKEILRNKYATSPNTFTKVTLENGTTFGRRILSDNNDSDYNMGSIIDGCQYGLTSIANEAIKPELANSYFSATHILSQETINNFVTSKKPEERYQALSVNFGTSIFSPFESNILALLSKMSELDKEIKQVLDSKSEIISTLKTQIGSKVKDISGSIKEANNLIDVINNLNADFNYKPLRLEDNIVWMDADFGEHINRARSIANLDYSEIKEQLVVLRFLINNVSTWKEDNKELNRLEVSISKNKKLIDELEVFQKAIVNIKNEITVLEEKLKPFKVQRLNIQNAIKNLPHFIEASKKISKIESAIQRQSSVVSTAKKISSSLEETLEDKRNKAYQIDEKLNILKSLLSEMKKNENFFNGFHSMRREIIEVINKDKDTQVILKNKCAQYSAILKILDTSGKNPSIVSIIENQDYISVLEPKLVTTITEILGAIKVTNNHIEEINKREKNLVKEEEKIHKQFSESRQLLSNALTKIDRNQVASLCPVCDTQHKTDLLVHLIENKLGVEESNALNIIHADIIAIREIKKVHDEYLNELSNQFKNIIDSLSSTLITGLASAVAEESLLSKAIENNIARKKEVDEKYERLISDIDSILESKPREYALIISTLNRDIEESGKKLEVAKLDQEKAQKSYSENKKILRDNLQFNKASLSEIATLKDTVYLEVKHFLEYSGIKSELSRLSDDVRKFLSQVENEEKMIRDDIKNKKILLEGNIKNRKNILSGKGEEDIRKEVLEQDKHISKLEKSLSIILRKLSKLEISPAEYTAQYVRVTEKKVKKELENQEKKYAAFDRLLGLIKIFKKYNSDNSPRMKVIQLEKEVESLKTRKRALGVARKNINHLKRSYPSVMKGLIKENLDVDLFNQIYKLLNPHRRFNTIDFNINVNHNRIGINFNARHSKIKARPEFLFSSAQLNTFGICMFLSMALRQNWLNLDTILIDDPIQNLDDINILSFIDFLRSLLDSKKAKKQIVLSTHDERFYDLMLKKFKGYNVKSFKFESYGKLTPDILMQ